MTAVARWWAPSAAGIGPDEVDLALLEPGLDGPRDLGQALLALHRVGAAACEATATLPLADESTLVFALVNARAQVVPAALGIVSKAVDDAAYAGLLLKDTLDDAEAAALSLWRTCMAKGMASTMAATRVGAVYGVPIRELGRYTALASDPKSRPDMVADLADRTLFGFVAKVVDEEGVQTTVAISKDVLEAELPTSTDYLDAHNVEQAEDGRFQREGAAVGRTVQRRSLSRRAVQRRAVVREPTTRAGQSLGSVARAAQTRGQSTRATLSRGQQKLASMLASSERPLEVVTNLSGTPRSAPDLLKRRPDLADSQPLWKPVSFVMSNDEWAELASKMGVGPDGERLLRSGGLTEYLGKPVLHEDEFVIVDEHEHEVRHVAELINGRPELRNAPPRVIKVLPSAVVGEQLTITAHELYEAKRNLLLAYQDDHGVLLNLDREIKYVDAAMDSLNHDDLVLVYTPPTPGLPQQDRLFRAVVEVFIDLEATRGHETTSKLGADVLLDPNIALRAPGSLSALTGRFFQRDVDGGTFRIQVHLDATDDADVIQAEKSRKRKPFGKALTSARFAELETEGTIERDESTGEFMSPGRTVTRRAVQRRSVQRRPLPITIASARRAAQDAGSQQRAGQAAGTLSRAQIDRVAQVAAQHQHEHGQGVFLDESFDYTVLDMRDLGRLIKHTEAKYLEQMYEQDIPFSLEAQLGIKERDRRGPAWRSVVGADQARLDLIGEAENEWAANMNWAEGLWSAPIVEARVDDVHQMAQVAQDLDAYLAQHPKVQRVHALMTKDIDGKVRVVLRGNKGEMPAVHMVRWHDELGQRLTLKPEGARRLLDVVSLEALLRMRYEVIVDHLPSQPGDEDTFTDPVVFTWRAVHEQDEP